MAYTLKEEMKQWRNPYYSLHNSSDDTKLDTGFVEDDDVNNSLKPIDEEDANLEAERGEVVFNPEGQLLKVRGNKHSNGGTPLNLPKGSFVFSDFKKLAFNKKDREQFKFKEGGKVTPKHTTPAKTIAKEVNIDHHNKMLALMKSDKFDDISKTSARLMLEKNMPKIGQVAYLQEEKKGFPQGLPAFTKNTAPSTEDREHLENMNKQYRKGGSVNPYLPKAKTGLITGDEEFDPNDPNDPTYKGDKLKTKNPLTGVFANDWNAMKDYSTLKQYGDAVGFVGNSKQDYNPLAIQRFVMNKYPDVVAKFHADPSQGGYGQPYAGRPDDGRLGVRWNAIANAIRQPKPFIPGQTVDTPFNRPTINPAPTSLPDGTPSYTPNPPEDQVTTYENNVPRTFEQNLVAGNDFYNLMNIKKLNPMRNQASFTPLRLEKINAQPFRNAVNNQVYESNRFQQALSPVQARAMASRSLGQGLDKSSEVEGNIYNQNIQQSNQENQYNNQGWNRMNEQNAGYNSQYYDQVQQAEANFDNLKSQGRNQALKTLVDQSADNKDLELRLDSMQTNGNVWVDPATNMPVKGISDADARARGYQKKAMAPMFFNPYSRRVQHSGIQFDYNSLPNTSNNPNNYSLAQIKEMTSGMAPQAQAAAMQEYFRNLFRNPYQTQQRQR